VNAVATGVVDERTFAVTGGTDGTVRLWDLATCEPVGEPLTGHAEGVWAVATVAADGRPLAVTGGDDEMVRVWDLITRQQIGSPLVFPLPVGAVGVAPGGRLLVGFGSEVAVLSWC
jgi:WD40 repeat protein